MTKEMITMKEYDISWPHRPKVMIESPYRSLDKKTQAKYILYARNCMMDSLLRGEAPFAGHLLYTQVLDDDMKAERDIGMCCDMEWLSVSEYIAVYTDYGLSEGMERAISSAEALGLKITYRSLGINEDNE